MQVLHFMAINAGIIMQKFKKQLTGFYGWMDLEEANAPGPFTYK